MVGYAIIWVFFLFFALIFLSVVTGYYSARLAFRLLHAGPRK